MNIIRARFMHQHKDKSVYESEIVLETPTLTQYDGKHTLYFEFEVPLFIKSKTSFMYKWVKSGGNTQVTHRRMCLVATDDSVVMCELSNCQIEASFFYKLSDFPVIKICCVVDKDEARKIGKIFF